MNFLVFNLKLKPADGFGAIRKPHLETKKGRGGEPPRPFFVLRNGSYQFRMFAVARISSGILRPSCVTLLMLMTSKG